MLHDSSKINKGALQSVQCIYKLAELVPTNKKTLLLHVHVHIQQLCIQRRKTEDLFQVRSQEGVGFI